MWEAMRAGLERRARGGVGVRFMYDGTCSLMLRPHDYPETLRAKGIQCKVFSPMRPAITSYQNNRDHRKICVVDGNIGFMGGINMADEYINAKVRFGHWKDTGVRLVGTGVANMTEMYLQMGGYTAQDRCPGRDRESPQLRVPGGGTVRPV